MPLKDLPPDARPREKLLARGASALSHAEPLALVDVPVLDHIIVAPGQALSMAEQGLL